MRFFVSCFLVCLSIAPLSVHADLRDATFYSDSFEGAYTSNGDVFSQASDSAAVCGMSLGQYLYVQNNSGGVVVQANDRLNCNKYPGVIDLSRHAFSLLGSTTLGRISGVQVTPLGGSGYMQKKVIGSSFFLPLGVQLDSDLSNTFFAGEGIVLTGKITSGEKNVLFYLKEKSTGVSTDLLADVTPEGKFRIRILLPKIAGEYILIISAGNSFQTSLSAPFQLIERTTLQYPVISEKKISYTPRIETDGHTSSLSMPSNTWGELILSQDEKKYTTYGSHLILAPDQFTPGSASVGITGFRLSGLSSLDRASSLGQMFSGSVILDRVHEKTGAERVNVALLKKSASLKFTIPDSVKIRDTYFLTFPNGEVRESPFASRYIGADGFLLTGTRISLSLPLAVEGTYQIEFVQADGLAYVNIPVTRGPVWNILAPDILIRKKGVSVPIALSKKINILRVGLSKDLLLLDPELSRLAQIKVDDMIAHGYVGHVSPDGIDIGMLAKQKGFTFSGAIGENIASGNVGEGLLEDGLEESGSHRMNMLRSEWKRVGIGYAIKNGETYIVQIFAE